MDLRFWHLHRGVDLSFVDVPGFFFVTTECTVDVAIVIVFAFEKGKDVVEVEVLVVAGGIGVILVDLVVGGVIEEIVTDNVVEWAYVGSWLLTDASFWIRRIFIWISV